MLLQEKFIPTRVVKPNRSLPWITNDIRKLLKRRRKLHKATKSNTTFKSTYKKLRSEVQRQIRKARWDHIHTAVTSDEHGNNKGFWSYVRRFKCDNTGIAVLIKNGLTDTSPAEKAKLLNKQFSSVFTYENKDFVPQTNENKYPNIGKIEVTSSGVEKLLSNLNASIAAGPVQLSGKLLKANACESAQILQIIFQRSLDTGELLADWKKALITPVFIKASRIDPANHRRVSLTCICCKLLEHFVNRHTLNHLVEHKILADSQYYSRKGDPVTLKLLLTCHDLPSVVNDCGQVDMLVLDFAKAFDTVAHARLLAKVKSYGITNGLQNWLRSFLEGRTQKVVIDGETSDAAAVKSGVPQRSVLGLLLFLIFINDLAEHTSLTVRLFADDCVMYKQIANGHDCRVLQDDLNQLHKWDERWQLKFNKAKCNIMRATHARQKKIVFGYELDGVLQKTHIAHHIWVLSCRLT